MSLKMRYYYVVGIWSFCFVLPIMMGCMRQEKKSSKDSFEMLYQQMEQASVDSPEQVSRMVDNALPSLKDSMMYYRLLFLKVRGYFLSFKLDSASYLLDKVAAFCDRTAKNKDVYQLYALIYNARGNLFVRTSQIDSASFCFQKAFEYASRGGKRESLPDICLNLADVFVKQGRYDLGSFWYNRSLSISDSLNMPDEQRFPAYYGLAQVNMELRDFALCDYYYDLASRYYDKMHPFEKHIYLNNRGNSYYYRQDYKTALGYFRRSLEVVNQYPDMTFERNLTMINLGEIFLMLDCTDSASYYLQKCRGFFDSIHHATALYCIDTQLMELALKQGNVALARERLKHAVKYENVEPNMIHVRNRRESYICSVISKRWEIMNVHITFWKKIII
jgi:tetratricopeptide (TPR) repeat protein